MHDRRNGRKRGLFWRAVSVHHGGEVRESNSVNGDGSIGGAVLITVDQEAQYHRNQGSLLVTCF